MNQPSYLPKPITEYDLRLLRIFKAVVEAGGFSAAEGKLGVTKSTISNHMTSLETRMQLTLCLRGRGGFSLTDAGQQVYQGLNQLLASIDDFALLVNAIGKTLSGELTILTSDQFAGKSQRQLAEVVTQLNEAAPELHLVLDTESVGQVEQALLNDKAHIGIIPGYHHIDGLEYSELVSEPIFLCCGAAHPFFDTLDSDITSDMLRQAQAIHPGIDINIQGKNQLAQLNLAAKAYQFDTRKTMIMSGRYVGFLPQSHIQQEINSGLLRLIKPDTHHYPFNLSLVSKQRPREQHKIDLARKIFAGVFGVSS